MQPTRAAMARLFVWGIGWAACFVGLGVLHAPLRLRAGDGTGGVAPRAVAVTEEQLAALRAVDTRVLGRPPEGVEQWGDFFWRAQREERAGFNARETKGWSALRSRPDWEAFRQPRLDALRTSLGEYPALDGVPRSEVTRSKMLDGFELQNVVLESRPGVWITGNLYRPRTPPSNMPVIAIIHAHHTPKTNSELQTMGATWSRLGCLVWVPDQVGHGERRQHALRGEADYPETFRPSRQDYYFRFNSGMQLHAIGDSLIGWMVFDMRRSLDWLLAQPGADASRTILLGSVAGGGDPSAVAGALDSRWQVVAPFNFGGASRDSVMPTPVGSDGFNYMGGASWETTRNLRGSGPGGFAPWLIVGAVAPRRLIYAHEFAWDREQDPVWTRLNTIYGWHDRPGHLDAMHGKGNVRLQPPQATHCTHIGEYHRRPIYPLLKRWHDIPVPDTDTNPKLETSDLLCLTEGCRSQGEMRPLHAVALDIGRARATAFRHELSRQTGQGRRELLGRRWTALLGEVEPFADVTVQTRPAIETPVGVVEPFVIEVASGSQKLPVPALWLRSKVAGAERAPVVVVTSTKGKRSVLAERTAEVMGLLAHGVHVCLVDLRGQGETVWEQGEPGGRNGAATTLSAAVQMLGRTLLGDRLRELRTVLAHVRGKPGVDPKRIGLWAESLSEPNAPETRLAVPLDAKLPRFVDAGSGQLALLAALFEPDVAGVLSRRGITSFEAFLTGPYCYFTHDAVVPGAFRAGDVSDLVAELKSCVVRHEAPITGTNTPQRSTSTTTAPLESLSPAAEVVKWWHTTLTRAR